MKLFFDFDDTVFDTQAFARGAEAIFTRYGVTEEMFWNAYRQIRGEFSGKGWCYSFNEHITKLRPCLSGDEGGLRERLGEYIADTSRFVFPDVSGVFRTLTENDHQLIILSFGDPDFQRAKVAGSGLGALVSEVMVTSDDKGKLLYDEGIRDTDPACFFDDKVAHIEDVKRVFPHMRTVLVHRSHKRHTDTVTDRCDFVVSNLGEAMPLLFESKTA